jgi:hypothetical protein
MKKGKIVYVDKIPNCDFCVRRTGSIIDAKYDGKTVHGPWANMCQDCFNIFGLGRTGLGLAQELRLKEAQ